MKRATIEDVARAAGVSRQTVSRAINNKGEISPATRSRVLAAVEAMSYRPNRLAQGMVTQRTQTIGLVVGDITNPFFPEVARGVQDFAKQHEYSVVVGNTDENAAGEIQILHSFAAHLVDGIVLFAYNLNESELRQFANQFHPIVLVNRQFQHPNISSLMVRNEEAARQVANFLVEQGHTAIGMIAHKSTRVTEFRRVAGFQQGLLAHGLSGAANQLVLNASTLEGGYQAAQELLTRWPTITAIFAYNDVMALGAVRACRDLGRRVPEDCSIIGFDDISLAAMTTPALSTVAVDKYAIGYLAAERLFAMLDKPQQQFEPIYLDTSLVIRESTRARTAEATPH